MELQKYMRFQSPKFEKLSAMKLHPSIIRGMDVVGSSPTTSNRKCRPVGRAPLNRSFAFRKKHQAITLHPSKLVFVGSNPTTEWCARRVAFLMEVKIELLEHKKV